MRRAFWPVVAFFALAQFFLKSVMFGGRQLPPEPDDSYHYMFHIRWMAEYGLSRVPPAVVVFKDAVYASLDFPWDVRMFMTTIQPYFGWSFPLGLVQRLTGLAPETLYAGEFYAGCLVAALACGYFARRIHRDAAPLIVLLLAFFAGNGRYHGFYWVVPSFYTLCFYFVLFGALILRAPRQALGRRELVLIGVFTPWLLATHPTGWFLIGTLLASAALWDGLEWWRTRNGAALRGPLILAGSAVATLGAYVELLSAGFIPQVHFSKFMMELSGAPGALNLERGGQVLFLGGALAGLALWRRSGAARRLTFQFALFGAMTLALRATGNSYPFRFFLFMIPFALALVGLGAWEAFEFARAKRKKGSKRLAFVPLICVLVLVFSLSRHSLAVHRSMASSKNFVFDHRAVEEALAHLPSDAVLAVDGGFAFHYLAVRGGFERAVIPAESYAKVSRRYEGRPMYFAFYKPSQAVPQERGLPASWRWKTILDTESWGILARQR